MLPPAPARFSTTTCWPRFSASVFATMRATVSVPPPGSKPTTVVTGLPGKPPCARAPAAKANAKTAAKHLMAVFLLRNDAGVLHYRSPLLDFVPDERKAVLRRTLNHGRAARLERVAHLRVLRGAVERLVEPHHRLARRRRRRGKAEPGGDLVSLQAHLVQRRHLGHRRRALEAGHGLKGYEVTA